MSMLQNLAGFSCVNSVGKQFEGWNLFREQQVFSEMPGFFKSAISQAVASFL